MALINSISDFRAAMRNGPYAWPGGYPLYFVTADGEALSFDAAKQERRLILEAIARSERSDQWRVLAVEVNWEDADLRCAHTGERIPSAYAEPDEDEGPNLEGAELFADSNRGVYIPQHFAEAVKRDMVEGVTEDDYKTLEAGPDAENEWYWDTWTRVCDNAVLNHPTLGKCYLYQDGDLWIVPTGGKR